jgi:hypothetical protein
VVDESQRDWPEKLPSIMAAIRSTTSESTGYSANFLMFGRENRAPIDLVLGPVIEEQDVPLSYDDFVDHRIKVMQKSYQLVRQNLGRTAERMKQTYDMRVRPASFQRGDWVWYFHPRRFKSRNVKWQRFYTGPYLVIKVLDPVNVVIQKSPRSDPVVTHVDKCKAVLGNTPDSWLPQTVENTTKDGEIHGRRVHPDTDFFGTGADDRPAHKRIPPQRTRRPPAHLREYECYHVDAGDPWYCDIAGFDLPTAHDPDLVDNHPSQFPLPSLRC